VTGVQSCALPIYYPFIFIALLGVFGYAFNKKFLFPKFWQIYLFFIILWDLYRNFNGFEFSSTKSSLDLSLMLSLYFLIYTPAYVAIYLYGHHEESHSVKERTKILLVLMSFFLSTNAITYKMTHESIRDKNFITHVKLDAITLRMYDQNNSSYLKIMLPSSIIGLLYDASQTDDLEKYMPICKVFDEELFEIVNRYEKDNNKKYGTKSNDKTDELLKNIKKGQDNIKNLCSVKTTD